MKRRPLALLLALFLLLSACGGRRSGPARVHQDDPIAAAPLQVPSAARLTAGRVDARQDTVSEILSLTYDLGEVTRGDATLPLRGHLSLPREGENLSLVMILHGCHDTEHTDAGLFEGFSYLTDALARRGYAAVSLDIQSAYVDMKEIGQDDLRATAIAEAQLDALRRSSLGEDLFPVPLTGRLDLNSLILCGHSRGGDTALNIACGWENVVGAVGIAPGMREASKPWRDIPMALLIPALDGDVTDLDGYAYLYPRYQAGLSSPTCATLLAGANHNYFNSMLTANDAAGRGADLSAQLSPHAQQAFLADYVADFCDMAAGRGSEGALFDLSQPTPQEMYGQKVKNLYVSPNMVLLSDSSQGAAVTEGCQSRRLTVDTRTTDLRVPLSLGTPHTLTLWELSWTGSGGAAVLPLTAADLSGYAGLALDLSTVQSGPGQELILALEDSAGHTAGVRFPAPDGMPQGAAYTTFGQLRVPFSLFPGIAPSRLSRLALLGEAGEVVLVSAVYGYTT